MTRVDAAAPAAGASGSALMERAGGAVAAEVANGWPDARRILVLAGPGNNGGDGFVAARKLAEAGREVLVALLGDRESLKGDAAVAAARWTGETGPLPNAPFEACDLVIDALFGAGLGRPIEGAAADAVSAANASGLPIVSVDVPSGLDGATGRPLGDACVRASLTVTFVRLKPGHVLTPGRSLCGRVVLADIGMPEDAVAGIGARAFLNRPALWRDQLPAPSIEGHKYSRGHVAVWSGPELSTGAARLSALAALRSGAGAVTLLGQRAALKEHAAHLTAVMLREAENDWAEFLTQRRVSAVVVGPAAGPTERTAKALTEAIEAGCHVVMDADVFSLFAGRPDDLAALIARGSGQVALTPHEGEFARVFGVDKTASKLERARAAAARSGATVLLKGADTVVATPDGRATVADNAPPYLATAGAGDVLAGLCAGLLAQGAPAFEAASAAVWLHGEAATAVGRGLIADDLPGAIPEALRRMEERAAG
ncbi:bifunctional NAD(P)H-hydrate repair enzyme [Hansschlegelia plantiphila]|uniref:Bifunctional NAD(P)H-hydrate repair enzyme n=2 Tax=Hansschlegelia plantiphila TaxID=374655 RepID=A0A9W6IZD8_9HYPH|nr:bifunctional NAD(P)H-hydrate repair enzyme [Hansschlegelia plantiphila]